MEYTLGKFKSTDVFVMATLLSKIGLGKMANGFGRDNIMGIIGSFKGKKNKDDLAAFTGMQMALTVGEIILSNLEQCETEVFKLLHSVSGLSVDDLKNMDAEIFAKLIIEVIQLQQFKDFFKVASGLLNTAN